MAKRSNWRLRALAAGVGALACTSALMGAGCAEDDGVTVECDSTRQYFAEHAWPVIERNCIGCHTPQGAGRDTEYVLKGSAEAGFLDYNLGVIKSVASLEKEGESVYLLKPTAAVDHGGGPILDKNSDEYKALLGLVVRLKNEDNCEANVSGYYAGVEMLSPGDTLRKAAIMLVGRLPLESEVDRVKEGGEAALEAVLDEMMTEEAFITFVKQVYGDLFETDEYLNNASDQLDGAYANPDWYETASKDLISQYGLLNAGEVERYTDIGLAREPVELVAHVVRNDRPFSEIVSADYMVVTPFTARSYGATGVEFTKTNDPLEYAEARLKVPDPDSGDLLDFPHAGVISTKIFLRVNESTPTNRNRARARVIYKYFLGTDILKTAEQPLDQSEAEKISLNPTRDAAMCTVCHAAVDPVAGTMQAFNDEGDWTPGAEWFPEMFPPGFGKEQLQPAQFDTGAQWLAQRIAEDDRFALSAVFNMYRGLTGQEPLTPPADYADPLYKAKFNSFLAQSETFRVVSKRYKDNGENLKTIVKELVLSPYFRAKNSIPLNGQQQAALSEVGMAHLLTPEQLDRKVTAVLGMPWLSNGNPVLATQPRNPASTGVFQLFYGGVAAPEVTTRITAPNGLMASVAERMAAQMSCRAIPQDFVRSEDTRLLFPFVMVDGKSVDPLNLSPEDANGITIPAVEVALKEVVVHLHERVLGEHLSVDDPEVQRTYQLFLDTWREGNEKMAATEEPLQPFLPGECVADEDPYTGVDYPEEQQLGDDEAYIIRSWMAVASYLLTDYRFLYE